VSNCTLSADGRNLIDALPHWTYQITSLEQLNHNLPASVSAAELEFLLAARVARMATVDASGTPHVVPVCFAVVAGRIYTPLDQKPKTVAPRQLLRVRNVSRRPAVCLVVDRWSENWSELAWLQVRARAALLEPGGDEHADAAAALRERYPQYVDMSLDDLPMLVLTPHRIVSWRV
jgi:coenzyme F420-0:L-glutamate ligase/coenzyme F420-1:gamma-L-glutamate ligase